VYQDSLEGDGTRSGALLVFGGVALIILLALLAGALAQGPATPQDVAAELAGTPGLREPAAALRHHYPGEYRDMLARLTAAGRARGRVGVEREGMYFIRGFMVAKAHAMTRAPEAQLHRLAGAYLGLMQTLRDVDVDACARATMRGPVLERGLPPGGATAIGRVLGDQIVIARAGENGALPSHAPPGPADLAAWRERIEAIDRDSAVLIAHDAVEVAPPDRQCRAGIVLFRAIADLPPAAGAALMAELLRDLPGNRRPPPPRPTI